MEDHYIQELKKQQTTFLGNAKSVMVLAEFDETIQKLAIDSLDDLLCKLENARFDNAPFLQPVKNCKHVFETIKEQGSLNIFYRQIYNQCVVLLVSYFSSCLEDIFVIAATQSLEEGHKDILEKDIKLEVKDLMDISSDSEKIIRFLRKKDSSINFQDMQSTARSFSDYCDFEPEKGEFTNNIIVGQHCRHVIVHAGGNFTSKAEKQVKKAEPRTLKTQLIAGEEIHFCLDELEILKGSMEIYLNDLLGGLVNKYNERQNNGEEQKSNK